MIYLKSLYYDLVWKLTRFDGLIPADIGDWETFYSMAFFEMNMYICFGIIALLLLALIIIVLIKKK